MKYKRMFRLTLLSIGVLLAATIGLYLWWINGIFSHGPKKVTPALLNTHLSFIFGEYAPDSSAVLKTKLFPGSLQGPTRLYISCKIPAHDFSRFVEKKDLELIDLQGKPDSPGDNRSLANYVMAQDFVQYYDPSLKSAKWGIYIPDSIGEKLLVDESTSPTLLVHIKTRTLSRLEIEKIDKFKID